MVSIVDHLDSILGVITQSLTITFFVFVMMVIVEAIHILSNGRWEAYFCTHGGFYQYLWAAILGATPGCLGSFAAVTLFQHRMFSLGALVTTMIATSGDEAFVMLYLFPQKAILLTGIMVLIGLLAGYLTDRLRRKDKSDPEETGCDKLILHPYENVRVWRPWQDLSKDWRRLSLIRMVSVVGIFLLVIAFANGILGPPEWNWERISFILLGSIVLLIMLVFPEHFIEKHLWEHVIREHLLRIFLWTFGAMLLIHIGLYRLNISEWMQSNPLWLVLSAGLIGVIPESGPHLLFVTLFSKGFIGFIPLLVSSIVQDGHGMLPLLAFSRKRFVQVKAINLLVGLLIGGVWLLTQL